MRMNVAMKKVSQSTVVKMVCEQLVLPYHFQVVQSRNPSDYPRRAVFSLWPLKNVQSMHILYVTFFYQLNRIYMRWHYQLQ
jgi:hypothetical protein